jgi:hypothetical protein
MMERMIRPEDALAVARERAARARARGGYALDVGREVATPPNAAMLARLLDLAERAPDLSEVRSTRRLGGPITFAKRALVRSQHQYHRQLVDQRREFDVQLALYVGLLAERLERLERRLDG